MDLHPGRNIYLTSWFILSQIMICLLSLHVSGIPHHMDLHNGRNVYLTSWFILSVLFLTGMRHLWSLHVSESPVPRTPQW